MASMILSGDTSGTVTLSAPLVAGSNTATLPAATGTVALTSDVIGVGQTFQNVSGSRNFSTNHTNSTGKPIMVYLTISTTGGGNAITFSVTVNSIVIQSWTYQFSQSTNNTVGVNFIVPNGSVYNVAATSNGGGISSKTWIELS